MRIVVHDYPGHAFPMQLSRALARRGHAVRHVYFAGFQAPKGPLARTAEDPPGLEIVGLTLERDFPKYDFVRRWAAERAYAGRLVAAAAAFRPDVVLGGNGPLDPQARLQAWCRGRHVGFLFWLQDIYGVAIGQILTRRLSVIGRLIGARYQALERRLWRRSDQVVAITEDFLPILAHAGVVAARITVIENWSVLEDLPPRPRDNAWARAHGLVGRRVFLYSGTMGLKHDPGLLIDLARHFRYVPDITVLVISEGLGADAIARAKQAEGLDNLMVLPFQPYADLPLSVAAADVLVVVLEADAGIYSVPSKLLTYLCAGRAVLGAVPPDNLAARIIARAGAGSAVAPGDRAGFRLAATRLMNDPELRAEAGRAARAYAESQFAIAPIAARFEVILEAARAAAAVT